MPIRPTTIRFSRRGFTLIELLVTIAILTILVGITAASMSWSANKDRIPNAANEVSSFIMGARDRAIFRRQVTGVRLILDQNGPTNAAGHPTTVSSMMYIGSPPRFTGTISIEFDPDADLAFGPPQHHLRKLRFWTPGLDGFPGAVGVDDEADHTPAVPRIDDTGEFGSDAEGINVNPSGPPKDDIRLHTEFNEFERFYRLGLLGTGNQITLRRGGSVGLNFTLIRWPNPSPHPTPGPGGYDWFLSADFPAANVSNCMELEFEIELRPAILPNQEPRELPRGVCIDLEACRRQGRIPGGWYNSDSTSPGFQSYSNFMDILFSPRGTGTGDWSGFGLLHLLVTEAADVERTTYNDAAYAPGIQPFYRLNQTPEERPNAEQERVVTVNPRTGRASVSSLLLDVDGNNVPADPFQFAERGKTAK
jgi:prepilin-type N-terminal cleavage/methylation domain-containing protein